MHDSFHQLIREQSQRAAEEGLELQPLGPGAGTPGASGEPAGLARPLDGAGGALSPLSLSDSPPAAWQVGAGIEGGTAGGQHLQTLWTSLSVC